MANIPARRPRRDSTAAGAERSIAEAEKLGLIPHASLDADAMLDELEPREEDHRADIKAKNKSTGAPPFRVKP